MTNLPAHPDDQEPVIVHGGLPLYRLVNGSLVRDDLRGDLVRLQDARLRMNAMESELQGLRASPRERQQAKQEGDIIRLWDILGIIRHGNIRRDIFQAVQELIDRNQALAREIHEMRNRLQEYVLREDEERLIGHEKSQAMIECEEREEGET